MRRAECTPLADRQRRSFSLGSWDGISDPSTSPRESCEGDRDPGRELRRRLLAYGLAHCLTPVQREAVELCCIRGLTATQAAADLGVHPSTVSRRLGRAMERLRKLAASA